MQYYTKYRNAKNMYNKLHDNKTIREKYVDILNTIHIKNPMKVVDQYPPNNNNLYAHLNKIQFDNDAAVNLID
jgi:hypothetical protein